MTTKSFPPAVSLVLVSLECLGDRWWGLVGLSYVFEGEKFI